MTNTDPSVSPAMGASENAAGGDVVEPTRWDERYDDPQAGVVLVSSDGVGFRLSGWYLAKESKRVADLLPSTSDAASALRPIALPAAGRIVRAFADLVTSSHPLQLPEFDKAAYIALFGVCDMMQCAGLVDKLRASLVQRSLMDPWGVFELASQRGDVELARDAIRNMGNGTVTVAFDAAPRETGATSASASAPAHHGHNHAHTHTTASPATRLPQFKDGDLDGVQMKFLLGLLRARLGPPVEMQHTRHPHTTEWACPIRDWIDTAEAFEV